MSKLGERVMATCRRIASINYCIAFRPNYNRSKFQHLYTSRPCLDLLMYRQKRFDTMNPKKKNMS